MTHEKKIKALIEAGEKATCATWTPVFQPARDWWYIGRIYKNRAEPLTDHDSVDFACAAANARESIKLLAEIAEAAEVCRVQGDAWERFDALWAKYKEAQNDSVGAKHS